MIIKYLGSCLCGENCGSALPNIKMDGNLLVVPVGSIDSDINFKPQRNIYYASKANGDIN